MMTHLPQASQMNLFMKLVPIQENSLEYAPRLPVTVRDNSLQDVHGIDAVRHAYTPMESNMTVVVTFALLVISRCH